MYTDEFSYRYSVDDKVEIGRQVYTHEITKTEAAKKHEVSIRSIVDCVKLYMKQNNLTPIPEASEEITDEKPNYNEMSKEELIKEIMKKDIEVARAKKGYIVKGCGKTKEFSSIKDANIK